MPSSSSSVSWSLEQVHVALVKGTLFHDRPIERIRVYARSLDIPPTDQVRNHAMRYAFVAPTMMITRTTTALMLRKKARSLPLFVTDQLSISQSSVRRRVSMAKHRVLNDLSSGSHCSNINADFYYKGICIPPWTARDTGQRMRIDESQDAITRSRASRLAECAERIPTLKRTRSPRGTRTTTRISYINWYVRVDHLDLQSRGEKDTTYPTRASGIAEIGIRRCRAIKRRRRFLTLCAINDVRDEVRAGCLLPSAFPSNPSRFPRLLFPRRKHDEELSFVATFLFPIFVKL